MSVQLDETAAGYINCQTCGRYIRKDEALNDSFCSIICSENYTRCEVCGNYFLKNEGFGKNICSQACAVQYKIAKTYQNETISIKYREKESE